MIEKLKELETGNVKGEQGEEGLKINYFEILTERMKNELGSIIKCASKVLAVTNKGRTINPQLNEKAWESMAMQIKSLSQKLINQSLQGETNEIVTIAKLMDIKDSLYAQIFEALLYKKTLLYEDLDLNNNVATEESNIIYMSEKVVQMHEKLQDL